MLEKSKRIFRRFISSRWFPLAVACAALLAVLVVAFLLGFRITYAPELENSWEAISAVASWAGIIVSIASAIAAFMAVWYAIRVSDKQNRISLFEKKYELFEIISDCKTFSDLLENAKCNMDVRIMFFASFCYRSPNSEAKNSTFIAAKYLEIIRKIKQVGFLFGEIDGLAHLPKLIGTLTNLLVNCCKESKADDLDDLQEKKQKFSDYINSKDYKDLIDAMQNQLLLK